VTRARDRVVVVSPHLDDAVLSAWLVLDRAGPAAEVVTCFAGLPPADAPGGHWDVTTGRGGGRAAVAERRREDLAAVGTTGAAVTHLDLLDGQYRPTGQDVSGELTALLRERLATAAEVWLPAAIGGHPDHLATRHAALAASVQVPRRRVYADLPYAAQPAWPSEVTRSVADHLVRLLASRLGQPSPDAVWRDALAGLPGATVGAAELHRLTRRRRAAKWRALRCYDSQLAALRLGPGDRLRRRRVLAWEACWTLPPGSG
jgi:LmbE family N-acetylglucosaminyl deacetylase